MLCGVFCTTFVALGLLTLLFPVADKCVPQEPHHKSANDYDIHSVADCDEDSKPREEVEKVRH